MNFTGSAYEDKFNITLKNYQRQCLFDLKFQDITSTTSQFTSEFDGYLGLGPYSENPAMKSYNFMWQLKNLGLIEHLVFSIYISTTAGRNSYIKFGDYDDGSIKSGETLRMFKTNDVDEWSIPSSFIYFNGAALLSGIQKKIEFDPHFPYIYIPEGDWTHIAYVMG